MPLLLAALHWDPQIRGFLIVFTAVAVLPGSVFLVLSTNLGARLGLLLAITGLAGWMAVMGGVWMVFGIGLKGRDASWKSRDAFTGPVSLSTLTAMQDFPKGWKKLPLTDPKTADAQAASDRVLAPSSATKKPGEVDKPDPIAERFQSPFKQPTDYVTFAAYTKGGDNFWFTIGRHHFNKWFRHSPHYEVLQVKPNLYAGAVSAGAPPKPEPKLTAPTTSVIIERDLGSVRFPPFVVMVGFGLVFAVCCVSLHERDKEVMRLRAAAVPA